MPSHSARGRKTVINFSKARGVYLDFILSGIPEHYQRYILTAGEESTRRYFLIVANLLNREDLGPTLDSRWDEIVKSMVEDIQWEIKHGTADVMNKVGILNAVKRNKDYIYQLSRNLGELKRRAKQTLLETGFQQFESMSPEGIFDRMVPWDTPEEEKARGQRMAEMTEKLVNFYSDERPIRRRKEVLTLIPILIPKGR